MVLVESVFTELAMSAKQISFLNQKQKQTKQTSIKLPIWYVYFKILQNGRSVELQIANTTTNQQKATKENNPPPTTPQISHKTNQL